MGVLWMLLISWAVVFVVMMIGMMSAVSKKEKSKLNG